jgi:hypothetical protein
MDLFGIQVPSAAPVFLAFVAVHVARISSPKTWPHSAIPSASGLARRPLHHNRQVGACGKKPSR